MRKEGNKFCFARKILYTKLFFHPSSCSYPPQKKNFSIKLFSVTEETSGCDSGRGPWLKIKIFRCTGKCFTWQNSAMPRNLSQRREHIRIVHSCVISLHSYFPASCRQESFSFFRLSFLLLFALSPSAPTIFNRNASIISQALCFYVFNLLSLNFPPSFK